MIKLENRFLTVLIDPMGAQLSSIKDRMTNHEFLWQGDPEHWGRKAPVLFPIIGRLKDGKYSYNDEVYELEQHGFARDMLFNVETVTDSSAIFSLESSKETKEKYPFDFILRICYVLYEQQITVSYEVLNTSRTKTLYYSVGGHPGFNVGMKGYGDKREFQRLTLSISPGDNYLRIPLDKKGLVRPRRSEYINTEAIELSVESFKDDALIFRISDSAEVTLNDNSNGVWIDFSFNNFPNVGIWSPYPKPAPFVCIEPWAGIADTFNASGKIEEKMDIQVLEPYRMNSHDYAMTFKIIP